MKETKHTCLAISVFQQRMSSYKQIKIVVEDVSTSSLLSVAFHSLRDLHTPQTKAHSPKVRCVISEKIQSK